MCVFEVIYQFVERSSEYQHVVVIWSHSENVYLGIVHELEKVINGDEKEIYIYN